MSSDPFHDIDDGLYAAARAPYAVVPSDTTELPVLPKALYVGSGGDLVLCGVAGSADVRFRNVPSGSVIDVRAQFVRATGTTAGDIVALA